MQGMLDGSPLAILGLYSPNSNQYSFLNTLDGILEHTMGVPLVTCGDFNCVSDVHLDRSHPPLQGAQAHKSAADVSRWMDNWHLLDTWRSSHPLEHEYTFYSHVHKLHTRIDMVMTSACMGGRVQSAEILPRTYSGHNTV